MAILSTLNVNERKAVLIVAIDFGTTYSGASYAFSDNVSTFAMIAARGNEAD